MKIHTFEVGPGNPAFIVAEGGSNHGGSLDAALALTDSAADAGANAMKWQFWLSADEMYDRAQFPVEWETTERYKLPGEWLGQLCDRAHGRGMAFGLSSFGLDSLDEADKWVDFHKVASIEAGWRELVIAVTKKKKPILISNGMSEVSWTNWPLSVEPVTAETWDKSGGMRVLPVGTYLGIETGHTTDAITLHCTVAYPAELCDADLRAHPRGIAWGLSDHTLHPTIAPCAAVSLGACVIEKHLRLPGATWLDFHLTQDENTPDAPHSIEPDVFRGMVDAIRLTEMALGSSEKRIRPAEERYLKYRRGPLGLRGA